MKPFYLETSGKGFWSQEQRRVKITNVTLGWFSREIRVFFDKKSWDTEKHGLIYTDPLFIKQLREHLFDVGMPQHVSKDIDYTEQGMQGDNFVSLEFGQKMEKQVINFFFGD